MCYVSGAPAPAEGAQATPAPAEGLFIILYLYHYILHLPMSNFLKLEYFLIDNVNLTILIVIHKLHITLDF